MDQAAARIGHLSSTLSPFSIQTVTSNISLRMERHRALMPSTHLITIPDASIADAEQILRQRLRQVEMKNRLLRTQLSQMRLANDRYYKLVEEHETDSSRRHQYIGELLVQHLSCECTQWMCHSD